VKGCGCLGMTVAGSLALAVVVELSFGAWYTPQRQNAAVDGVVASMQRQGVNVQASPCYAPHCDQPATGRKMVCWWWVCSTAPISTPPPTAPNPAPAIPDYTGRVYAFSQLQGALEHEGLAPDRAHIGAAIAEAESGGRADAVCASCAGVPEYSIGPWQVNLWAHQWVTRTCAMALDCAAHAAAVISGHGADWTPWSTYVRGTWRAYA
jgi:hypothetical protein